MPEKDLMSLSVVCDDCGTLMENPFCHKINAVPRWEKNESH